MRKFRLISCLLITFFLFSLWPGLSSVKADQKHFIAGYGPVYGNLLFPIASKIIDDTIYVMDSYGISSYSLPDNQFISRFPIDIWDSNSDTFSRNPKMWFELIRALSGTMDSIGIGMGAIPDDDFRYSVLTTIEADLANHLYIPNINRVDCYSTDGDLLQTIPYPPEILPSEQETAVIMFRIAEDKLYLFVSTFNQSEENESESQSFHDIYEISKEGSIINTIHITSQGDTLITPLNFCVMPDRKMFAFSDTSSIYLVDTEGNLFYVTIRGLTELMISQMAYTGGDTLICSGLEVEGFSFNAAIKKGKLLLDPEEDEIYLDWEDSWKNQEWGLVIENLTVDGDRIGFVSTGTLTSIIDFQVNVLEPPDTFYRIGKPSKEPGQIVGSLSYAVDQDGNLYTTNFGSSKIEVFNKEGQWLESIEIDLSVVSSMMGVMDFMPTISDMSIESNKLIIANFMPNTISSYDLETEEWTSIYTDDSMEGFHCWIDMHMFDNSIYLLDPFPDEDGIPQFFAINEDEELNRIELLSNDTFSKEAIYTGFEIDDANIYFLDGSQCKIYQMYFPDPEKINNLIELSDSNLPEFFSFSFCLLDNGDFILTDPVYDRIIRINNKGEIIRTWGKSIHLSTGTKKEVYQTNPEGLNLPLRVKEQNNILYISDFLNCRYHILPVPFEAPNITVKDFIELKDFSVFREQEQTIEIAIESEFLAHFQVKTDQDWIQIKEPSFTSETKELHITLLGSKMKPWANNYGYLHISCDEMDMNDQNRITIDISVDTVGIKIQLTIDDSIVLVNDKPQPPIEAAPFIVSGRTMVPIRFISENFGAVVEWDAATHGITITVNDISISMQVGNPVVLVNGKEVKLDVPAVIRAGRTFVPLRFISETFGAKVEYESATRKITIWYPAP